MSPKDRATWDSFQMAKLHGSYKLMGVIQTTYESRDDPPSIPPNATHPRKQGNIKSLLRDHGGLTLGGA